MPGRGAPIVEVVFRDEASSQFERTRQRMRGLDARGLLPNAHKFIQGLEAGAQRVRWEGDALIRLSGVGAVISGGLVASLAKITQALGGFARSALQSKYLASELGLTVEQIDRLTVRGMALGQTREQARSSIEGVVKGLRDLQTEGTKSHVFQELAKDASGNGARLARELMAMINGPGGIEAGIRLLAERMKGMTPAAQRHIKDMFGLGSVGFAELFKYNESELNKVLQPSIAAAERYALALANLNNSFGNIKTTLANRLMPQFERMNTAFDSFLQGAGDKIVKQFADWLGALEIDWDALFKGLTDGLEWLKKIFVWIKKIFIEDIDPLVQRMGGWTVVIGGLAIVLGTKGLAGWLGGIANGFKLIAEFAFIVPLIAGLVVAARAAPAGAAEAPGGALVLPEVTTTARRRPWHRSGRAVPDEGAGGDVIPPNAQYRSGTGGGEGYYVPGYGRVEENTSQERQDLRRMVRATREDVEGLSDFLAAQAYATDESGAGGLAGFAGAIRDGGAAPEAGGAAPRTRGGGEPRTRFPRSVSPAGPGGAPSGVRPSASPEGGRGALPKADVRSILEKHVIASELVGTVPPDGPAYGIKTGSKEEWIHLFTELAGKESSYNPRRNNFTDPGGSFGLWQVSPLDVGRYKLGGLGGTRQELYDPDTNARVAVGVAAALIKRSGGIYAGMRQYWSPIRKKWVPVAMDKAGDPTSAANPAADPSIPREPGLPPAEVPRATGDAGSMAPTPPRTYDRRRGEPGEFNAAYSGEFGPPGQNQTTIRLKNGQSIKVNAAAADRFQGFFNEMIDRGYPVDASAGGFVYRQKRGGGGLSIHSWGTAVDINVNQNQFRGKFTNLPPGAEQLAWQYGLSWGGRFGDPMHFEAMGETAWQSKIKQLIASGYTIPDHIVKRLEARGYSVPEAARTKPAAPPKPSPILWSNESEINRLKEDAAKSVATEDELGNSIVPLMPRRSRFGLKINVRGPSGVKVSSDSDGVFKGNTTVSREKAADATGGGVIESPA